MRYFKEFEKNLAYYFSEALEYPFAKPSWIYMSLSHKCMYNCQMCGVVKILKGYELPAEVIKKSFDEISQWGWDCTVMLTGGEVFLRKDVFELIDCAVKRNLKIEAVSNGSLIDKTLAYKIISSGLLNIAVSLDGAKEVTHDSIREKGSFKKAVNAIENLVKIKKELSFGPQISVWTTIMKENVKELFDITYLARDLGVECLVYHPVIVAQDDMQNTSPAAPFWIKGDNIAVLKEEIDKIVIYKEKYGLVAFLHDPYLWIKYFEGTLSKRIWKCNPFVFINIGPDGEVRSCGSSFGNIKDFELEDCLNTKESLKARKLMKTCQKPCLQTCWAYPEADSLISIIDNFISNLSIAQLEHRDKVQVLEKALNVLAGYENVLAERHIVNIK